MLALVATNFRIVAMKTREKVFSGTPLSSFSISFRIGRSVALNGSRRHAQRRNKFDRAGDELNGGGVDKTAWLDATP